MIVKLTDPAGTTGTDQPAGRVWIDGVTYLAGDPADVTRSRDALLATSARQRPSADRTAAVEVTAVPDQWAALASAADRAALLTAYSRLRALDVVAAIPVAATKP